MARNLTAPPLLLHALRCATGGHPELLSLIETLHAQVETEESTERDSTSSTHGRSRKATWDTL